MLRGLDVRNSWPEGGGVELRQITGPTPTGYRSGNAWFIWRACLTRHFLQADRGRRDRRVTQALREILIMRRQVRSRAIRCVRKVEHETHPLRGGWLLAVRPLESVGERAHEQPLTFGKAARRGDGEMRMTALRLATETARVASAAPDCSLAIAVAPPVRTARSTFLALLQAAGVC
jgi:hypothetical protein